MVARRFSHYRDRADVVVFASGVSNSKTSTPADFLREEELLKAILAQHTGSDLVYFSTTSIGDPDLQDTAYVQHKLHMESIIAERASRFHIFRVSNLAGSSKNPHTILNYFFYHIAHREPFELWKNSERNIIDTDDVMLVVDRMLEKGLFTNGIVNIANTANYPVPYIVQCMEDCLRMKAIYSEKEKGKHFNIDTTQVQPLFNELGIHFTATYLPALLQKYFSAHEL